MPQVAEEGGGHIIQQFIDEQGNIIQGQIISTEEAAAIYQEEPAATVGMEGETGVTIESQQIFETQVEGQEVIDQDTEVIQIKHEDLQPGDSLLKPR